MGRCLVPAFFLLSLLSLSLPGSASPSSLRSLLLLRSSLAPTSPLPFLPLSLQTPLPLFPPHLLPSATLWGGPPPRLLSGGLFLPHLTPLCLSGLSLTRSSSSLPPPPFLSPSPNPLALALVPSSLPNLSPLSRHPPPSLCASFSFFCPFPAPHQCPGTRQPRSTRGDRRCCGTSCR